jgi:hypothetical protein
MMQFKLFKTHAQIEKERRAKYCEWHDYFAWMPTHIGYDGGKSKWAWFETVERHGSHSWNTYRNMPAWFDYRVKEQK